MCACDPQNLLSTAMCNPMLTLYVEIPLRLEYLIGWDTN